MLTSYVYFFFFKQKTAYEMRISDWSSDVCSSDLHRTPRRRARRLGAQRAEDLVVEGGARPLGLRALPVRPGGGAPPRAEIGRASCRERVCQYVQIPAVAVTFQEKITNTTTCADHTTHQLTLFILIVQPSQL